MQGFSNWIARLAFYPLLFGASLGIWFSLGLQGFILYEQIPVLCASLALSGLLLNALFLWLIRDSDKAAVMSVVVLLWVFSFGNLATSLSATLEAYKLPIPDEMLYLIPYCIAGLLAMWFCYAEPKLKFVSKALSWVILALFIIGFAKLISYLVPVEKMASNVIKMNRQVASQLNLKADWKPDIYYIILDSTGSAKTLRNVIGIQDLSFFDYLKKQGFYIADQSHSNYDRTMLSMSSSLNFSYINYLEDLLPKNCKDFTVPFRLMQDTRLFYCLKNLGYKIVDIGSSFPPTEYNPSADINVPTGFCNDVFLGIFHTMTVARPFEKYSRLLGDMVRDKKTWNFTHIDQVECIPGPKFVMIHILLPHPPFVFAADGGKLPLDKDLIIESYTVPKYRSQAIFTFSQAPKMIDSLLKASAGQAIIIVQGDHGPATKFVPFHYADDYLKERFGILNAYYLPKRKTDCLYSSITPVNTFRVILNQYFHANLPLLPDKSYYAPPDCYSQFKPWAGENNAKVENKPVDSPVSKP